MLSDASIADETSRDSHDRELQVLQHIAEATVVRQRDIARIVGMSLGMTNSILKRLARKGLITIRKINNRNVMYAVSPRGFEQIARRSYRYLRRTVKNVVVYRRTIESLITLAAAEGFGEVDLIGESDLDFVVEHACRLASVELRRVPAADRPIGSTAALPGADASGPAEVPPKSGAPGGASGTTDKPPFLLHSERLEPPAGRRGLDDIERAIVGGACEAYLSELLI